MHRMLFKCISRPNSAHSSSVLLTASSLQLEWRAQGSPQPLPIRSCSIRTHRVRVHWSDILFSIIVIFICSPFSHSINTIFIIIMHPLFRLSCLTKRGTEFATVSVFILQQIFVTIIVITIMLITATFEFDFVGIGNQQCIGNKEIYSNAPSKLQNSIETANRSIIQPWWGFSFVVW